MTALVARGLCRRFGATSAVADVDLTLASGEVRGLLGPNGAGKTTLLRMLLGLLAPDQGSVEFFGSSARGGGRLEQVGGFVETPWFYPYLSGRANLEVLAELDGGAGAALGAGRTRRRATARRVEDALQRVGLDPRAKERVAGYSTGMRQRLGIAAALIRSPRMLILDEPTSGLDPDGAAAIVALILALAADGVSVLLSSHQIGELEAVCDSYTVLRRGHVVWDGSADHLREQAPGSAFALRTSDDNRTLLLARRHPDVVVADVDGRGLRVSAEEQALDALVLELAREGVAVRGLELLRSPLEAMFFALTGEEAPDRGDAPPPSSAKATPSVTSPVGRR